MFIKPILISSTLVTGLAVSTLSHADNMHFMSEIYMTAGQYCPRGSVELNGQSLQIQSHSALFSVLGTLYGGDGRTTFSVPDMRGRTPVHTGNAPGITPTRQGEKGGSDFIRPLGLTELPAHTHTTGTHRHSTDHNHTATLKTHTGAGTTNIPEGNSFATFPAGKQYAAGEPDGEFMALKTVNVSSHTGGETGTSSPAITGETGGSRAIRHRSPFLTVRYCMSTNGQFPSRN